jgi:hypothetical protein
MKVLVIAGRKKTSGWQWGGRRFVGGGNCQSFGPKRFIANSHQVIGLVIKTAGKNRDGWKKKRKKTT